MAFSSFGGFAFAGEVPDEGSETVVLSSETENVRFVNGAATTNGDGLTAQTPYNSFASAASDLATSGGTIVIVGDADEDEERSTMTALGNTGDILITSVYDGVDYRDYGANLYVHHLHFDSSFRANPGKITFDNIDVTTTEWSNWHVYGHELVLTENCTITEINGKSPSVQIMAFISTGGNSAGSKMDDTFSNPVKATIGNDGATIYILGPCEDLTIGDADITVNGTLDSLAVSNNTWENYDHGMLTIDGDVTVTVNGTLGQIYARAVTLKPGISLEAGASDIDTYSLAALNGNLAVIVGENGTLTSGIMDPVKQKADNWFVIKAAAGTTLAHGENGGDIVLSVNQGNYSAATLTNTTTGNTYMHSITNGSSAFTLTESGEYTVALSNDTVATVSFVDSKGGNTVAPKTVTQGSTVTLPSLESTDTTEFLGWASSAEASEAEYSGGAEYTVSADATLYAVWKTMPYPANVRFVNGTASTNGDGRTPETAYNTFASAASILATNGGTIVIVGVDDGEGATETTTMSSLGNTGDILITSVYDGVDYRTLGALLEIAKTTEFGVVENPGKITFDDIEIRTTQSAEWELCGHETVFTDTCNVTTDGVNAASTQIYALSHDGDGNEQTRWPAEYTAPINLTIGNDDHSVIYVGPREPIAVNDVNITVDGRLYSGITLANYAYGQWWGDSWYVIDQNFGALTVNGEVKITVNGTLPKIDARKRFINSSNETDYSTLDEVKGNLGVLVNHGGSFGGISDVVKEKTTGLWYTLTGVEGAELSYGENANNVNLTVDGDYNVVTLTNTTSSNTYKHAFENGSAAFTISESGDYTMELSKVDINSVSFVDSMGSTVDPMLGYTGDKITLPTLSDIDGYSFEGWAASESATDAEYQGGEEYTITATTTLYAVWSKIVYPENVRFVNGTVATNGDGRSPLTPYKKFASAAADFATSGGTIVVTGNTKDFTVKSTGDIVITSVYNGIDYREKGAMITASAGVINFGLLEEGQKPGKVTMENLKIQCISYDNWKIFGYGVDIKDTVKIYVSDGVEHDTVQLLLHGTDNSQILPDSLPWDMDVDIGTKNCGSMIFGPREDLVTGGYDITVDGYIGTIAVSNNTYEKTDWPDCPSNFGRLTIDGDVKITANGTINTIRARKHYYQEENLGYGLETITGSFGVIINHGGKLNNPIYDDVKERTEGKWFTLKGIEGVSLAYGESAEDISLTVADGYDYNYVTIANATTGNSYSFLAGGGECEFTIPESGDYTMTCSNKELYGVVYSTSPYADVCPESYYAEATDTENHTVTLPTLPTQAAHYFLGWSDVENASEAKYQGGSSMTLSSVLNLYAVWEAIPTFTVTFLDDNGEVLHTSTGIEGAPIEFPTEKLYRYREKFLGFAYEGTQDILSEGATIPAENKTAVPVWGDIPAGELRLYVNAETGSVDNDGESPDKALPTIESAVEKLREDGGYIIVTGSANALTSTAWNNKGDITLTSIDPASGIDYRSKTLTQDKLTFTGGGYVTYGYVGFGDTDLTGKITIENLTMVTSANYMYLCFNGHPYEIGRGLRVYMKTDEASEFTPTTLCVRSLGEQGSAKTGEDGIVFTLVNPEVGELRVSSVGKAENTVKGIFATVDSDFTGNLYMGNDSQGGKVTIAGDVKLVFNGTVANAIKSTTMTYPIEGNLYALCNNNGAGVNVDNVVLADGYKKFVVTTNEGLTVGFGSTDGELVITENSDSGMEYVTVSDADGNILDVIKLENGTVSYTLTTEGEYTLELTDKALAKLTLDAGCDEYSYNDTWNECGVEVELPTGLYRYGYLFGGWKMGETVYTDKIEMPEENITLTAIWTVAPKYTVTFDANGSSLTVPESISEYVGETIVLERLYGDDTFIGWNEDPNAYTGFMNYTVNGDKTLYAITAKDGAPAYILDTYYRGDVNNYTGTRNSFRRFVIDVYLENAVASEGKFKLDTDNGFLYYLGHVPQEGIDATVTANVNNGNSGVPGLQCFVTPSIEFTWTSKTPVDTTNGRIRIARIMMYFSSWGMGYNEIEKRTTDEIVSAFEGYTASADNSSAYVSASFYKGAKSDEVEISGKATAASRADDSAAMYDGMKLYIVDSYGDTVEYINLEKADDNARTVEYKASIAPGEYIVRAIKDGYLAKEFALNVTEAMTVPEIVLAGGDTLDANGNGDGVIDVDDFIRILRAFSDDFPLDTYIHSLDLNEDGAVNVQDLMIVKKGFEVKCGTVEVITEIDSSFKDGQWKYNVSGGKLNISGGSDKAVASALQFVDKYFDNGSYYGPVSYVHTPDYDIDDIVIGGTSLSEYSIVIAENDETAQEYADYIAEYIEELSGIVLPTAYDTEEESEFEIIVGKTSRKESTVTTTEGYDVFEENGKIYVFYGDEQGAEMAALDLCEKILGKESEGFANGTVTVADGARSTGAWSVLTRFGVMSDSHVGIRYNWVNYDWLHNAFTTFENAHESNPLDFVVSLGDNIDDGYASTYATDYAIYLEEIKELDICDPVNPIDGRADGMIPHYELCGNHDPIGGQLDASGNNKIRFFKNRLWYTENESGEKVAHIGFFTNYGGYPLYSFEYSNSYESYYSYGKVNDEMVKFVEESIIEANGKGAKHIILYNHFGMSQQVGSPCLPETGLGKIASVCEKYGIKLYFNGHEHDKPYTLRRYNDIYDYDTSMTADRHAIVEITSLRAKVTIYNSKDNSIYRTDIVPLSGRGEAKQTLAQ